jgi:hypothetical protein
VKDKRVRLRASDYSPGAIDTRLIGRTGVVTKQFLDVNSWVVKLDQDVPGFYSGEAFVYECEMEVIG